jgi:geranylgeranyl diphosphate synthase type II
MNDEANHHENVLSLLQQHSQAVSTRLKQALAEHAPKAPQKLIEAMEYSLLAGGKRLRPALVLESFAACAGAESDAEFALTAAAAMELIHTFSLVHDDLPAMDDDDLRRGRATNHKVFGEAMAILAGDAMMTVAFEILAADTKPQIAARLVRELAHASGPAGMIGGQVLDMAGENQSLALEQLQQIHRMKTGALLTTSCRLGAIAAGADDTKLQSLTDYGRHTGLAFQIIDDVLDVTSTREQLGKATNKDASRGKNTYPALLGLDASRAEAQKQLELAMESLSSFDSRADGLRNLARFIISRQA